jgi:hypothetical protein
MARSRAGVPQIAGSVMFPIAAAGQLGRVAQVDVLR